MKIKSQRDFLAGGAFTLVGVLFALGGIGRAVGSADQPGPGFFACTLGLTLAVLGLAALFKSLAIETEGGDPVDPVAWRALLGVLAVASFGLTVQTLGLVFATAGVVVLASWPGAGHRWGQVLALAGALTLFVWLVLGAALSAALPLWPRLGGV